jgi:hypothetical protein
MSLGSGFGYPAHNSPGITRAFKVASGSAPYTLVTGAGTANPEEVIATISGWNIMSLGVITTAQGDPNGGNFFASGSTVEVTSTGTVPVQLIPDTYAFGDAIVAASGRGGWGKKLTTESGAPMMIIGTFVDIPQVIASGFPNSVQLSMNPIVR